MGVVVADPDLFFIDAVVAALHDRRFRVLGTESHGEATITTVEKKNPDVVALARGIDSTGGLRTAQALLAIRPELPIVLLTHTDDGEFVWEGLKHGVRGFVLRAEGLDELGHALRNVARGAVHISRLLSVTLRQALALPPATPATPVTRREEQILALVARGFTMKEVSAQLGVSVRTAESHRSNLMRKLEIHSTAALVRYAIRRGLIVA